jgi:hypothetical protein
MKGMNSVQPQPSLVANANNLTKAGEQLLTQVTHLSPS